MHPSLNKKKRNWQHYCSFLYLLRNDILKLIDNMHKICSLAESVHDSNDLDLVISHLVKIYRVISLLSYCLVLQFPVSHHKECRRPPSTPAVSRSSGPHHPSSLSTEYCRDTRSITNLCVLMKVRFNTIYTCFTEKSWIFT